MAEVVELWKHRPHVVVHAKDGNVHVIPMANLDDIIRGDVAPASLGDAVLRRILEEWRSLSTGA